MMTARSAVSQRISEAKGLMNAASLCNEIWNSISSLESNWSLSYTDISRLFDAHQDDFRLLLLVNSPEELMDVLDEDQVGQIQHDEQLLLFSLVKERMEQIAIALRLEQQYVLAEQLMHQVRILEQDIMRYQQELRQRIYGQENKLQEEVNDREEREFREIWELKLNVAQAENEAKLQQIQTRHQLEQQHLESELASEQLRSSLKPRESVLGLQSEERFAAITEKYSVAKKAHLILHQTEAEEEKRQSQEVRKTLQIRMQNLLHKQKLDLECAKQRAEQRIEQIKRRRDAARLHLNKEISHRGKILKKIQDDGYREGTKMGLFREELRRRKDQSKRIGKVLEGLRYTPTLETGTDTMKTEWMRSLPPDLTPRMSHGPAIKMLVSSVAHFHLRKETLRLEAPVISNAPIEPLRGRLNRRRKSPPLKSIAALYSPDLTLSPDSRLAKH